MPTKRLTNSFARNLTFDKAQADWRSASADAYATRERKRREADGDAYVPKPAPKPPVQIVYLDKLDGGGSLTLTIGKSNTKTWTAVAFEKGKAKPHTLGRYPRMSLAMAKEAAGRYVADPERYLEALCPREPPKPPASFKVVAEDWYEKHVLFNERRSAREIKRQLGFYVYPRWQDKPCAEIDEPVVNTLLDEVASRNGARQADYVLAIIRPIFNWYAGRDFRGRPKGYVSPVVKGMQRDRRTGRQKARDRVLSHEEIKALWAAADTEGGNAGGLAKLLLLTAQRLAKVVTMRRDDVVEGVWRIRSEKDEKGHGGNLKLPSLALDVIAAVPLINNSPFVFPGNPRRRRSGPSFVKGKGIGEDVEPIPFNSLSQAKRALDARMPQGTKPWRFHDLRRTARTLMEDDADVSSRIAEQVLGHEITGIEAVYNRSKYEAKKADALAKLAAVIERIVNPPPANV